MKYVALLRGISPLNPNMRNDKLRGVFEKLGFKNVKTVISSGNVLFETSSRNSQALEERIEKALTKELGFSSTTIVRSKEDLQRLVERNPFGKREDVVSSRFNVTFLKNEPTVKISFPYHAENKGYTLLENYQNAICAVIDLSGAKTPDVMLWLEKQYGKEITTRTWKTVLKTLKKLNE